MHSQLQQETDQPAAVVMVYSDLTHLYFPPLLLELKSAAFVSPPAYVINVTRCVP